MSRLVATILSSLACLCTLAPDGVGQHVHTSREKGRVLPLPKEEGVFHFVVFGDRTGGPKEGIRVLEQAVRDTNLLDPDLVMTVGDLIQGYNERKQWMAEMREFRGVMDKLRCRWFPVAGNHDIYWRGPKRPHGEHESSYETHFGPLWYWFEHKNAAFFVLYTDEGDPKDGSKGFREARHTQMSKEQLSWLRRELAKVRDKDHVFVFCHHPRWIEGRYKGNNWNAVHAILRDARNVKAVFGGHIHRMHYGGKRDGIEYHTLATTGGHLSTTLPGAGYLHHLNVVTVRPNSITHATIPVGAVLDPKQFTADYTAEIDALRRLQPRMITRPVISVDGSAGGTCAVELQNPTSKSIELVLGVEAGRSWSIGPDHAHAKLGPGAKKRFEFVCTRRSAGLVGMRAPRMSLQVDLLGDGLRLSLPERSMAISLDLGEVPASMFDAVSGGTLVLDGKRACVEVPSTSLTLPDGPITLECRFRSPNMKGRRGLVTKTEMSDYGIFVSDGKPVWSVFLRGAYVNVESKERLARGRWYHIAGVFDGRELRLYLDGRLVGRAAGRGKRRTNALPLIVGGDTGRRGPVSLLEGEIDEVRLSSVARYTGEEFDPRRRFEPDAQTALLLHCDRDLGPWVPDHSPARAHGRRRGTAQSGRRDPRVLHAKMYHLGDSKVENWPSVPDEPEGGRLDFDFDAVERPFGRCLVVKHYHVDQTWDLVVNGEKVTKLRRKKALADYRYYLPPGALKTGKNRISFVPRDPKDDIAIGMVRLHSRSFRDVLRLSQVVVTVQDAQGRSLPARVTISRVDGSLPELYFGHGDAAAIRPGVAYTSDGEARFEVERGVYRVSACRGTEWSLATSQLEVRADRENAVTLGLRREVETRGFVAADTHIHTFQFSGHGDASLQERLVTLAGEGVELAISTDHNHNIDYEPEQKRLGLSPHYKSVVGNEVTSSMGHFNAFPLNPADKVPEHRLADWIRLIDGIRKKGARVVILNHPRWPDVKKGPFGRFRLNQLSGERSTGPRKLTFDAMELVNSATREEDPLFLFRDWFALLNHGHDILAVGSSDSHTVGVPVGQGRTYVRSDAARPSEIDVDDACDAFLEGRTSISMGIYCEIAVNGEFGLGDTVRVDGPRFFVRLRVASASWIQPRVARVFVNGLEVATRNLSVHAKPKNEVLEFALDRPRHDAHVVCVVTGDPVGDVAWPAKNDYTLAATNPVWLDVDGGGYQSPRATAQKIFAETGRNPERVAARMIAVDDAVAVQLLSLIRTSYPRPERYDRLHGFVRELGTDRPIVAKYLATLVKPAPPKTPKRKQPR